MYLSHDSQQGMGSKFLKFIRQKILLGDIKACAVEGISIVSLKLHDDMVRTLQDVRYIYELKMNLISLSEFDKTGYTFTKDNKSLRIIKGAMIMYK